MHGTDSGFRLLQQSDRSIVPVIAHLTCQAPHLQPAAATFFVRKHDTFSYKLMHPQRHVLVTELIHFLRAQELHLLKGKDRGERWITTLARHQRWVSWTFRHVRLCMSAR